MSKISYSQISKYSQCPKSYQWYYKEKLREKTASAFLAFGSAIDNALNAILSDIKKYKQVRCDYKSIFDVNWQKIEINKRQHNLSNCLLVGYAKEDFASEILTEEDRSILGSMLNPPKDLNEYIKELTELKNNKQIQPSEHQYLNVANWLSMKRKAHLMLDAYVREVVPEIEEVKEIQYKIELSSDKNETLIGYIDAIVKFKGSDDYVVLDNKTAASPYTQERLDYSSQLSIYAFALGFQRVGYAVMLKHVSLNATKTCRSCGYVTESKHKTCNNEIQKKRCNGEWEEVYNPSCKTQLLIDNIRKQVISTVVENISEINNAIQANIFPKNLGACHNMFGKTCPYLKKCWYNNEEDLEKVE